jgi:hypothetical protein
VSREHFFIVILSPSDGRDQACKLPNAINLPVPNGRCTVGMALGLNGLARIVCVSLVRNTHLMMTYDFLVGDLFPSAPADEVLCFEAIVAKEMRIGDQSYEFICWYILPILVDNGTIVNLTKVRPAH